MAKSLLTQATTEHCLYCKRDGNDFLAVAVFVDDFFLLSNNVDMKEKFKNDLKKSFIVKDLGCPKDCLGMRVIHNEDS